MKLKEQLCDFYKTDVIDTEVDLSGLKDVTLKYPYFQGGIFFYLKALYATNDVGFQDELRRLAPFIGDRKALFYTIFSEEYAAFFHKSGKTELSEDRTGFLLDAFFERLDEPVKDGNSLEESILETGIVSVDYFSYIEKMHLPSGEPSGEPVNEGSGNHAWRHQNIIDTFIEKSESGEDMKIQLNQEIDLVPAPTSVSSSDDGLEDSMFFTETLSRIYIKQKKYEKAYKIIKQLSLNYPEKNIYFADQIRFLEKLIVNSSNHK